MTNKIFAATLLASVASGCVSKKQFLDAQVALRYLRNDSTIQSSKIAELEKNMAATNLEITRLNSQVDYLSKQNNSLLKESAEQKSRYTNELDANRQALLKEQIKYKELQDLLEQQKQKSNELRTRLQQALQGFNDSDLTVTNRNGKVYVSLSEKLLFPSASAVVNTDGRDALYKVTQVLNNNPDISVNIEGHTDSIPIKIKFEDNWALSVARANSIVRIMVNEFKLDPRRVTASGRSSFDPIDTNSTPEGRARNRRTEIILTPRLYDLFKLLEN
jgi:chemotaxis protein MotB